MDSDSVTMVAGPREHLSTVTIHAVDENTPLLPTEAEEDADQWKGLPWHKRPSAYWLLFPFIFSALAFGGSIVPRLTLIRFLLCRNHYSQQPLLTFRAAQTDDRCLGPGIQAQVSQFSLYVTLVSAAIAAVTAPKLGALSDCHGRCKIMFITNLGAVAGDVGTVLAAQFPDVFPIHTLLLSAVVDGVTGSFMASLALSNSYTADCTTSDSRKVVYGYFQAALFTGIALGPLLAAWILASTDDIALIFCISLACHLFFLTILTLFIPESLSKSRQRKAQEKHRMHLATHQNTMTYVQKFFEPLQVLYPRNDPQIPPAARRNLVLLATIDTLMFGVATGALSAVLLYSASHFRFTPELQSKFLGYISTIRVICLLCLLPLLNYLYRHVLDRRARYDKGKQHAILSPAPSPFAVPVPALLFTRTPSPSTGTDRFEVMIVRTCIAIDLLGFVGYFFASSGPAFIAAGMVTAVAGIGNPTHQALLTKHVPADRTGKLLGAMSLLHSIGRVGGPMVFSGIYTLTAESFDRAVFIALAGVFGLAFVLSLMIRPGVQLTLDTPEDLRAAQAQVAQAQTPDEE